MPKPKRPAEATLIQRQDPQVTYVGTLLACPYCRQTVLCATWGSKTGWTGLMPPETPMLREKHRCRETGQIYNHERPAA